MNYINQEDLEDFMQKYTEDGDTKPQSYCDAAMEMIKDYIGYNPEETEYTQTLRGDNGYLLELKAKPITEISSFSINGTEVNPDALHVEDNEYISFEDDSLFLRCKKYSITYKAGYEDVPALIKTTALQIASLFWESAGGNLAVSSTSFADTGSRVFNNFKADRFLSQLDKYKKVFN